MNSSEIAFVFVWKTVMCRKQSTGMHGTDLSQHADKYLYSN